jgi:hypothetical protein
MYIVQNRNEKHIVDICIWRTIIDQSIIDNLHITDIVDEGDTKPDKPICIV